MQPLEKKREGSVTKARISHEIAKEQLERSDYKRLNHTKQLGIPDLTAPAPPLLLRPASPCLNQSMAQSTSCCPHVAIPGSSPSDDSYVSETTPDE